MVRAHAMNAEDPSSNPAGGPLHVTPPSLSFIIYPVSKKGFYASKKKEKSLIVVGRFKI